jgi:hypothetical protein
MPTSSCSARGAEKGCDIYLEDIRIALGREVVAAFTPVIA